MIQQRIITSGRMNLKTVIGMADIIFLLNTEKAVSGMTRFTFQKKEKMHIHMQQELQEQREHMDFRQLLRVQDLYM